MLRLGWRSEHQFQNANCLKGNVFKVNAKHQTELLTERSYSL